MVIHFSAHRASLFSRILMRRKLVSCGVLFSWGFFFSGQARSHCSATRCARTQTRRAASGRFTAVRLDRSEWTRVCVRLLSSRESSTGTEARSSCLFMAFVIPTGPARAKHCHFFETQVTITVGELEPEFVSYATLRRHTFCFKGMKQCEFDHDPTDSRELPLFYYSYY